MHLDEHPLVYLLRVHGWSATDYLTRLSAVHVKLGYGPIAKDRKRITRWTRYNVTPDMPAQRAMAHLHRIPEDEITARPWPEWLKLACIRERQLLSAAWTPDTTLHLLDRVAIGGPMDRRGFLLVTGITPVLAGAVTAQPATAHATGRRIGAAAPELFEQSLAVLRRQDDQFGSGQVHTSARAQLRLITASLQNASYTEATGRRLHGAAAEAARICAWTAYDSGRHALAEEFYLAALRAAATAADPVVTANTLAFWAIQRYSTGDPRGAADLIAHALTLTGRIGSARMEAMLHARLARAHAKAGDEHASLHSQGHALAAYDRARDQSPNEDPDCVYWVSLGELRMLHGSCALNLGRPRRALAEFETAAGEYREDDFPRAAVIYLARGAEARIALEDLDGAVDIAQRAVDHMGGVTSARGTSTLDDVRRQFHAHRTVPVVSEFLARTA
ncbi:tetratricopeptide repeat protein [Streptomyces marincola]|uniref:tetratricopeptide repeat protein n=1 Tax=Streptomyces marincola TaxID=2878388 RepID=UPI001CF46E36|nr:transcriptional regulator [Streptomyces marincola]UCM90420.1 transcriptional regulator [Streptomyces marincola]